MKSDMSFQIECNGKADGSTWSVVFFKLNNGNIGVEIRNKGNMVACSPTGETANDFQKMSDILTT